jgi:Clp amino terminal domain, pathogenicity island component
MTELEALVADIEREAPDDPLAQLRAAARKRDELAALADDLLGHFVEAAREAGATWSDVGDALGVSKQAAQQRHTARPSGARRALGKLFPKLADGSFRRFTPRAREVVLGAQTAAVGFGHDRIATEHLLLGLYGQPGSVAVVVLERLGVDAGRVGADIAEAHPPADAEVKGHVPFADGAKDALEGSLGVAMRLGHNYIGTEHILLALLEAEGGLAAEVLAAQGVTAEAAEAEVVEILQGLAP